MARLGLNREHPLKKPHQVAVGPYLDEEELAQAEDPGASVLLELDRLVEGVGGVVATAGTHDLERKKQRHQIILV